MNAAGARAIVGAIVYSGLVAIAIYGETIPLPPVSVNTVGVFVAGMAWGALLLGWVLKWPKPRDGAPSVAPMAEGE